MRKCKWDEVLCEEIFPQKYYSVFSHKFFRSCKNQYKYYNMNNQKRVALVVLQKHLYSSPSLNFRESLFRVYEYMGELWGVYTFILTVQ